MRKLSTKYLLFPAAIIIASGDYLLAQTTAFPTKIQVAATVFMIFLTGVIAILAMARRKKQATVAIRKIENQHKNNG